MKNKEDSLMFSLLLSMNSAENHEVTLEDLLYVYNQEVTNCQIKMYQLVIERLSQGMTYEEISQFINEIDIEEYRCLTQEQQDYIQRKLRKDLNARKQNEAKKYQKVKTLNTIKNKGVINYE